MKCPECGEEMKCEVRSVYLQDKDELEFEEKIAYFTCENSDCCDFNKPTPMNRETKKPITTLNPFTVRLAIMKCA